MRRAAVHTNPLTHASGRRGEAHRHTTHALDARRTRDLREERRNDKQREARTHEREKTRSQEARRVQRLLTSTHSTQTHTHTSTHTTRSAKAVAVIAVEVTVGATVLPVCHHGKLLTRTDSCARLQQEAAGQHRTGTKKKRKRKEASQRSHFKQ